MGERRLTWFSLLRGVSLRWKVVIGTCIASPFLWQYNEHRKTQQKRLYYNGAIKDLAFLDFAIGNRYVGRVLIGLYSNQVPLSVENFLQLCDGYKIRDKVIGYRNTHVHRIFPMVGLMAGDVVTGTGVNQLSIYGKTFPDENFDMEFIQDGDVALCNSGPHSNSSHFMITFSPLRILHGQNVVIGTVLKGMEIIRKIEKLGTRAGKPLESVRIINSGIYRGAVDGPAFYTVLDDSTEFQRKFTAEEFMKLSEAEQKAMVEAAKR